MESQAPEPAFPCQPETQPSLKLSGPQAETLPPRAQSSGSLRTKSFLTYPFTLSLPKFALTAMPFLDPAAQTPQSLAYDFQTHHRSQCQAVWSCRSPYSAARSPIP